MRWRDALADLLFGAQCAGCSRPGLGLCESCRSALAAEPLVREVAGLVVASAVSYRPPVPAIVKTFKDGGGWGLVGCLADAVELALPTVLALQPDHGALECGHGGEATLVPVPSPGARVRHRGVDHTLAIARELHRRRAAMVSRLLLRPRGGLDQQGLRRGQRWVNQEQRFRARPGSQQVVLLDDVVTTGATLVAARDALSQAGHQVLGAVTVASSELLGRPSYPKG